MASSLWGFLHSLQMIAGRRQVLLSQEQGQGKALMKMVFLGGKISGSFAACPVSQLQLKDRSTLAMLDMMVGN